MFYTDHTTEQYLETLPFTRRAYSVSGIRIRTELENNALETSIFILVFSDTLIFRGLITECCIRFKLLDIRFFTKLSHSIASQVTDFT